MDSFPGYGVYIGHCSRLEGWKRVEEGSLNKLGEGVWLEGC